MGRLTEEKIQRIRKSYSADPNYTRVSIKEGVDRRTVMRHVRSGSEETIQDKGIDTTVPQMRGRKPGSERSQNLLSLTFKLLKKGVAPIDTAIELGLNEEEYRGYRRQFLRLMGYESLDRLYEELHKDEELYAFTELYKRMKDEGMTDQTQEFVMLLGQVKDLKSAKDGLEETQNKLSEKANELGKKDEFAHANNKLGEVINQLNDYKYNVSILNGRLIDRQKSLERLKGNKTYKKLISAIVERIVERIKNKDAFTRFFTLATAIALRHMEPNKRNIIINYSGQDRLLDENARSRFFQAGEELKDRTEKELSAIFVEQGLDEFEYYFEDLLSEEME